MAIECLVLGAGQEAGKSCVVATIGGNGVMFDWMHIGYHDRRRYPDFARVLAACTAADYTLRHLLRRHHTLPFGILDHIGALTYFTEVCGYHGPIYMTVSSNELGFVGLSVPIVVYT